jgi:hypothetical protein
VTKLDDALAGVTRLGFDTAPIIYLVELHARHEALVREIFQRLDGRGLVGLTSVVTLTEVLVQPLRQQNTPLQIRYRKRSGPHAARELQDGR